MKKKIEDIDRYWKACNYLSVGQIYLKANPLLKRPLKKTDIKKRLLGHWGTSPGLNFIYAHLNRLIQDTHAKMIYITGPGHGGPALRANVYLEGAMSDTYRDLPLTLRGLTKFMRDFSWPGGVPSHVSPPTPGSIHEGGELGYSLVHAFGAVLDNPELIAACVVGDGEAETGPLAASWQSNKFLNPQKDGAVLPILHLNGYKISGPTLYGRMPDEKLKLYFRGLGYEPIFVEGSDPKKVHVSFYKALDRAYKKIRHNQKGKKTVVDWPMIVLRTPKGWTGPKIVDGKKVEGTSRSHQVPLSDVIDNKKHFEILEKWLKSYEPEKLFDPKGKPYPEVFNILPEKSLRMGYSPYANGGTLLQDLKMPDFKKYALKFKKPGVIKGEATRELGKMVRDIFKLNEEEKNFRLFCPDETNSNRFNHVFEVTKRAYLGKVLPSDDDLGTEGRVMEVLSEHLCQGWLEGYLLTGRHGLFPCYEAFALIVDSMLNQHAKWLKACDELKWRKPIASLNYVLTSHAWRQDHNGYSHQGPGFIESVMQKKSNVARIYLPADANSLLSVADHCLRSKNYVNLIVSGKQSMYQWLNIKQAVHHCTKGASIWGFASDKGRPDIIMAAAGDTPTLEILAAVSFIKKYHPEIKIHMVNVVDLFRLAHKNDHPHGFTNKDFETLFPLNTPIIFAFHGHPHVIGELVYGRRTKNNFFTYGYIEEGTTTTPFDMVVCNKMSRFHLAAAAIEQLGIKKSRLITHANRLLKKHKPYIYKHGEDIPEVLNWKWS